MRPKKLIRHGVTKLDADFVPRLHAVKGNSGSSVSERQKEIPMKMLTRAKWKVLSGAVALVFATFALNQAAAAVTCESLASLTLPETTITAAQSIPAGTY